MSWGAYTQSLVGLIHYLQLVLKPLNVVDGAYTESLVGLMGGDLKTQSLVGLMEGLKTKSFIDLMGWVEACTQFLIFLMGVAYT